jgi:3-oxoacyl-[acyl-carrier protein] reductase
MKNLEGKGAIVTGGGTGLGAAVALGLARRGANVLVNYASSADAAERVASECRALGVKAVAVRGNVADDADCVMLAAAARDAFGRIDILINNAGVTKFARHGDLDALSAEDFQRIYGVNVIGSYQMVRAVRGDMVAAGGGSVVNVSSIAGVMGIGSSVAYAASKGALNTLTLSLARALAPLIRVNAVCPGYIASGWFTKYQGEAVEDKTAEMVAETAPLRIASTPEDIAGSILYFAGPESRVVTGEFIICDAGSHLGAAPLKAK